MGVNSCLMAQGEDNQSGVDDLIGLPTAPTVSLNVSIGHWAMGCGSGQSVGTSFLQRKSSNLELAGRGGKEKLC